MTTEELLKAIDPKRHEKYSPNLFKWLRRHKVWFEQSGAKCFVDSNEIVRIGYLFDGCFIGSRIGAVLCYGVKAEKGAYGSLRYLTEGGWREDTEFWPEYVRLGRCHIDPEHHQHFQNAKNRYTVEGENRTCNWCGYEQVLRKREEVIVHTEWVKL